ncbi:4-hydroxy-tetrahydrodipicolinate reductase [Allofournierella massiliensis]|uniref:4-hydroxy-tetrahydrodipicolinate reductase n=1 Tax=Allofournierella massiliensis TaxID=1650663 RepID=A0ABT7UN97_9FIRM|nr:4-hydroxy-tetrahydrodipicolinate reductase [Fournierella massiliensis]MDM8200359.1 4-hydroxy-tetrahydrodipicolinate reductase [Fournierella massiliensis]
MTDIIIQGINGRMGKVLCDLIAQRDDCRIVGGVDVSAQSGPIPVAASLEELNVKADVIIDFSTPEATKSMLRYCQGTGTACVMCTTGLDEECSELIQQTTEKAPVFKSANMSMGINLLAELAQKAAQALGMDYDIEIIEKHHHNKVDAPSGTALLLADEINKATGNRYRYVYDRHSVRQKRDPHELGLHAIRGGSIVGDHEILFCGPDEVITLSHSAGSRAVFANGAINAAVFLTSQKNGLYDMKDLMRSLL